MPDGLLSHTHARLLTELSTCWRSETIIVCYRHREKVRLLPQRQDHPRLVMLTQGQGQGQGQGLVLVLVLVLALAQLYIAVLTCKWRSLPQLVCRLMRQKPSLKLSTLGA